VAFSVTRGLGLLGPPPVSAAVLVVGVGLIAWRARATRADLGLDPAAVASGLRWGAATFGLVLVILLVGVLLPATNGFLHDSRAEISGGRLLYELFVTQLLITAIPEEFAFRGVLFGSASTLWSEWRAIIITSVLFGLWHIEPTLATMSDNNATRGVSNTIPGQILVVIGAVAATFVGGVAFCWLRMKSKSLVAPIIAHVATNGVALTVAWFAVHY
jgi:membrane protease YdiL (CAAX protease family)